MAVVWRYHPTMTSMPRAGPILQDSRFQNWCYASAITLFLAIVAIGSIPGAREDVSRLASGLVLHSVAYAVLGALIFLGSRGSASRKAICAVITIAVMGGLDEYVQSFWPYRTAAVSDWLVDVVSGAVISIVLWKYWRGDKLESDPT
jgi:VanZ family protein